MHEPRLNHVVCRNPQGLHRMAYWEWGDPANPSVLLCAHGLSRQGRDFDFLAQAMLAEYRVVCPDVVGRGQSDWLTDPVGYHNMTYAADMVTLIARLNCEQVDWVGTSMGGLIGLIVASLKDRRQNALVRRLVLNDVGPAIAHEAVARIGRYIGQRARWATLDEAADALWLISTGFGPHTREQWLALTRPMLKQETDGGGTHWALHYDPAIAQVFAGFSEEMAQAGEAILWRLYDSLRCPTLLLRGAESDLLSRDSAMAMTQRGPKAQLHEFAHVGHAPMLTNSDQVAVVRAFLHAP